MKISLLKFIEGKEKKLEIKKNIENLNIEGITFTEPVKISLELYKVDDDINGSIDVEFEYTEECSRCLKKYTNKIIDKADIFISSSKDELGDESVDYYNILQKNGEINIEDLLKEIFNINRPLKPLCSGNCKGLCPKCGVNLNEEDCNCDNEKIDPRMGKLKELLDKEV
ncbi:MAG: DUF177 domain-containing protein [Tissierellales bacterium]|jgi:uncharacterized protein|nr:DUF177 domain-containing protein [Tissierellales bacterium]